MARSRARRQVSSRPQARTSPSDAQRAPSCLWRSRGRATQRLRPTGTAAGDGSAARPSQENPQHANYRAAIASAFQGLLRSAEFCFKDGKKFNPRLHLTRFDVKELSSDLAIVMMAPCKNMKQLGGKTSPLVLGGGGTFIDAVAELHNLLRVDPTPPGMEKLTPLFCDPQRTKKAGCPGRCRSPT